MAGILNQMGDVGIEPAAPDDEVLQSVQGAAALEALPGPAAAPFLERWLLWADQQGRSWHQPFVNMAFTLVIAFRCWHLLTPPTAAWLAVSLAVSLADLAWRRFRPVSYAAWREVPAAVARLLAFGPWPMWLLITQLLDEVGQANAPLLPPQGCPPARDAAQAPAGGNCLDWLCLEPRALEAGGMAAHLALLLFASGAAKMAANALSLRTRLGVSVAVQLALLLASGRHTRHLCASAALASPAAQRRTRVLHQLLSGLSGAALIGAMKGGTAGGTTASGGGAGAAQAASRPSPLVECAAVVTWLRVTLALLLPLLQEAATEARLWRSHQAQRRQQGMPPEPGSRVRHCVHSAVAWLAWQGEDGAEEEADAEAGVGGGTLHAALVTRCMLAMAWEWCASILQL